MTLTFLLTFRCYGSWLPGDARGWVDRTRGEHRGGYRVPSVALSRRASQQMTDRPYQLDFKCAQIVLKAILEVCEFRGWPLIAVHVRATHVHCVLAEIVDPDRAIIDLKAYASRALNKVERERSRWAREGSTRRLRTERAIHAALRYVVEEQGAPMAVYCSSRSDDAASAAVSPG